MEKYITPFLMLKAAEHGAEKCLKYLVPNHGKSFVTSPEFTRTFQLESPNIGTFTQLKELAEEHICCIPKEDLTTCSAAEHEGLLDLFPRKCYYVLPEGHAEVKPYHYLPGIVAMYRRGVIDEKLLHRLSEARRTECERACHSDLASYVKCRLLNEQLDALIDSVTTCVLCPIQV